MAMVFTKETQLKQYLARIEKEVISAVSQHLLQDFQNHLEKTIYGESPGDYQRYREKGGFYAGWELVTGAKSAAEDYVKTLMYNPNNLIHYESDLRNGQIAHAGRGLDDVRPSLDAILNDYMYNDWASVNGGAKYLQNNRTGYWDSYKKGLDNKIKKWLDEEFSKYGIKRG